MSLGNPCLRKQSVTLRQKRNAHELRLDFLDVASVISRSYSASFFATKAYDIEKKIVTPS